MTLVLGNVGKEVAIQVSDRKLTVGTKQHDPQSNKSVIMVGGDGFICVSYSGSAYIREKPTDHVLAEVIADYTAPHGTGMGFGAPTSNSVGLAIQRLRRFADVDFRKRMGPTSRHRLQLLITGFLGRPSPEGNLVRPYIARLDHCLKLHSRVEFSETPRGEYRDMRALIGQVNAPEISPLIEYLNTPDTKDSTQIMQRMRQTIVNVSDTEPTVGPNCMGVVMSKMGHIHVFYLPDPRTDNGQVGYSPWVVGGGSAFLPPQIMTGGGQSQFVIGGFSVALFRIPPMQPVDPHSSTSTTMPRMSPPK